MYKYNIREEKFGATIYDLMNGKRFYLSLEELNSLYDKLEFPVDLGYRKKKIKNHLAVLVLRI